MKEDKWTTTKLVATGALAVLRFLTAMLLYVPFLVVSGSVLTGVLPLIIGPFFLTLTSLVVSQFGAVTLFLLVTFVLNTTLPQIFPVWANLAVVPIIGFVVDFSYKYLKAKNKVLFSFISGAVYNLIFGSEAIILYFTVGLGGTSVPQAIQSPTGYITVLVIMILVGGLTGLLAYWIYQKLAQTNAVKRIQA